MVEPACTRRFHSFAWSAWIWILLSVPVHAGVIVVDKTGGGDYAEVQDAVLAAAEGDVILIRGGHYASVFVHGKSLHLAGMPGYHVLLDELRVRALSASQDVAVTDVHIYNITSVEGNHGSVRLTRCVGAPGDVWAPGIRIYNSDDVILTDCIFVGCGGDEDLFNCHIDGQSGGSITSSHVASWNCQFIGGDGDYACTYCGAPYNAGGAGGPGAYVRSSELLFVGGEAEGGTGGDNYYNCCPAGRVGDGIQLLNNTSLYELGLPQFEHGDQGPGNGSCGGMGDGEDITIDASSNIIDFGSTVRSIDVPALSQESSSVVLVVKGVPGDRIWIQRAQHGRFSFQWAALGVLHLESAIPGSFLFLGVVPSSGTLTYTIQGSDLAAGHVDGIAHQQVYARDSSGYRLVGNSSIYSVVSVPLH